MPTKKKTNKKQQDIHSTDAVGAAVMLFAGGCVILLGVIQVHETIKYLLVGFGSALLVFSAVMSGLAIKRK